MAFPPINIYSQRRDPEGTLAQLTKLAPGIKVTRRSDGSWQKAEIVIKRGWLKKPLLMQVNHDPAYYGGDDWPTQLSGMQGYFGSFDGAEQRADLFAYLPHLNFAFNFILDPELGEADARWDIVLKMAESLQGVVFLPGQLLDFTGRVILSQDGENDPSATVPVLKGVSAPEAMEEAEVRVDPPTLERVVRRFLLLSRMAIRGFMETDPSAEPARQDLVQHLKSHDTWGEAEAWEVRALETRIGSLPEKDQWSLTWKTEGALILAWSLGLTSLPEYDQEGNIQDLRSITEAVEDGTATLALRSRTEIEKLDAQLLAIHWRVRQFYLKREAMDFAAFAPTAWFGPLDLTLARLTNNDLDIHGTAISECEEESWRRVSGLMEERRKALSWLLGGSAIYSECDTGT